MNVQRILLKIAYWLVAISIVVLIAFTFYARHIISQQSQQPPTITVKKSHDTDEETNFEYSGMSLKIENNKAKKEVGETGAAVKKDEGNKTDQK